MPPSACQMTFTLVIVFIVLQASDFHEYVVRWIYYVGFSVSITSLAIALFIFIYFR